MTLCTNGAHSLRRIKENFPELSGIDLSRARGTDLVRLRPASASVRFLRNFAGPPSESVLEADE